MPETTQYPGLMLQVERQRFARLRYEFLKSQLDIGLTLAQFFRDGNNALHESCQKTASHAYSAVACSLSRVDLPENEARILRSTLEQLRRALDNRAPAEHDGVSQAVLANGHQNGTNGHSNGHAAPSADLNGHNAPLKHDLLTRRELEVLKCIAEGSSTKEVADRLGITFKTASCHRSRIMDKLGVHNLAKLVLYAVRERLIQL